MPLITKIKELGLDDKEAKVYLAGLELGEANIQRIVKKSGIKRTTVYHALDSLKEKGLFSVVVRKGRKKYIAEDPRKLKNKIESQKETLEEIMPNLLSLANFIDKKPEIKYYEGEAGIKEIYKDSLNYPESEILAWVNSEAITNFKIDYLKNYYLPQRLNKKIWVRAIAPSTEEMINYKSRDTQSLRKTKLLKKNGSFNVETTIYGKDKVSIVDFENKLGLIIRNNQIFNTFKVIFEENWDLLD
ncbi:MAG: helix-turn-helix domain-containing protein [Patescibacteria group bacterium]